MASWDFDAPVQDPRLLQVQEYLTENLQSTKAGVNAVRMLSLYEFLKAHRFSSPEELRMSALKQGEPLFTPEEAEQVFNALKQVGGGTTPPPEFFDKMFRKLSGWFPGLPGAIEPWAYVLHHLEKDDVYGAPISLSLDITSKLLPTIATAIQTTTPALVGLIPLPGAGPVGLMIGWAVSAVFIFIAIIMNLSRRKFGTAFVVAMTLIPVAGPAIMKAAQDVDSTMVRVSNRREKLINSAMAVFGSTFGRQLDSLIPDLTKEESDELQSDPPFRIPRLTDVVNPGALVASQAEVEQLADEATGEAVEPTPPPPAPVEPSPAPVEPVSEQPLTTGKGRSRQWRKTLRSRRR